jgi:predicted translation initiation factor SUI1
MAPSKRTVLFISPELMTARTAANLFTAASEKLGLSWQVLAQANTAPIDPALLTNPSVIVAVDLPDFTWSDPSVRLERLVNAADLATGVNGLIARLLGGSDSPTARKPASSPPPPPPKKVHTVKVSRETAGRRGKGVTVVSDLPLNEEQLKELTTLLKNKCGTGGTAKDGRIEIQGDLRDRLAIELEKLGYKVKRAGG